jgi:ketosteroid isomerase-like protein
VHARLHREGISSIVGRQAIGAWLQKHARAWSGTMTAADAAESGDLGYSYGIYTAGADPAERGAYVRIWARDADGRWWLVADVNHPA